MVTLTHSLKGEVEHGRESLLRVVLQVLGPHKPTAVKVTALQAREGTVHKTIRQRAVYN